jgi:GntR family transcriptional regulator, carbon starvation induced regulator
MSVLQADEEGRPRHPTAVTLATRVYERLRADLLSGTLPPGEKLRMETLRVRYGVGASPLREALNRLSAEGLVAQIDQRGFRVAPVSVEDLRELTKARVWVTGIALRESITHGDAAWEERIVLAFHRMMRAVRRSPSGRAIIGPQAEKFHRDFHAVLIDACGSRWITDFAGMMFDCARRYQHLSTQSETRPRDVEGEHRAIMDAALARDAELAVKLHDAHIARTVEIVADMDPTAGRTP